MTDRIRRHAVYWSDKEVVLVERALTAYAQILAIQVGNATPHTEANDTARAASVVQQHRVCKCPTPIGEVN